MTLYPYLIQAGIFDLRIKTPEQKIRKNLEILQEISCLREEEELVYGKVNANKCNGNRHSE